MFAFFRTHQKLFYVIITVIIIITFSFFGTQKAMDGSSKIRIKDKVVSTTIDGKNIKKSEIDSISYFLVREEEIASKLNIHSSVFLKDFLESKLADTLAKKYFKNISFDSQKRLDKAHKFVPYVHPQVSMISAENIWRYLAPEIAPSLEALQKKSEYDLEAFNLFMKLYLNQRNFSSDRLRKILLDQQSQCHWLKPDRSIMNDDMNLFGFNSIVDWFGQDFVDLLSQVIINVASVAETRGYKVSSSEALADLMKQSKEVLSKHHARGASSSGDYFREHLSIFGLRESSMVDIWRKVLLFRKYMNDVGESVFLDNLSQGTLLSFNKEKALVELYHLPSELNVKDFESFMKLQVYLESISGKNEAVVLPSTFLSASEVEKKHPELVQKKFDVKLKHINLNEIGVVIGEKKLWTWQTEDKNYALLKDEFVQLKNISDEKEKRFSNLEKLDPKVRAEVDRFSRKTMLLSDTKNILEELSKAKEEKKLIGIKLKSLKPILKGIDDKNLFAALEKEQIFASDEEVKEGSVLFCYSDNKEDFYRITLLSKSEEKSIVSFTEALNEEIVDALLDAKLHAKYSNLSAKELDQVKDKDGNKKPFCEVKNELGAIVFHDLLEKIDSKCKKNKIKRDTLDSYASAFSYFNLLEAKEKMQKSSFDGTLCGPWKIEKEEIGVTRQSDDEWLKEELFVKESAPSLSDLHIASDGTVSFFKFISKQVDEKATLEEIAQSKKMLSNEAKQSALEDLLSELDNKLLIKFQINSAVE